MSISDLFKYYSLPNGDRKEFPEWTPKRFPQRIEKVDNYDFELENIETETNFDKENSEEITK